MKKLLVVVMLACAITVASTAGAQFHEWGSPEYYEEKRQREADYRRQLNQPLLDMNQQLNTYSQPQRQRQVICKRDYWDRVVCEER